MRGWRSGVRGFHEQDVAAYARLLTEPPRFRAERRATAERSSPAPSCSSSSSVARLRVPAAARRAAAVAPQR